VVKRLSILIPGLAVFLLFAPDTALGKVGPKSILPIQPKGATGVGLLAEINCPK